MRAPISNYRRKKNVVTTAAHKDWSNLHYHQDLINCFAEQIVSMKDFYAFGGVCRSWRSAAIKENSNTGLRLQHKVPVLLLPKEINAPICNFYSLTKGQIYQLDLPETMGKFCYSSLGWLLTVSEDFSKLHLFNPLTHVQIELPHLRPEIMTLRNINKFVLSSSPSWTSNYGVMIVSYHELAFYQPGYNNDKWTSVSLGLLLTLTDAIYYKGQFYVVDYLGKVFVCEIEDPKNAQIRAVAAGIPKELLFGPEIHFKAPCLVESATGTLLLVISLFEQGKTESTVGCRVFKVPFDDGNSWAKSEVKNLGNRTLFLGANNSSFSIEALDDSICKANCIYFLNRSHVSDEGHIDIGIYYMKDGKIERHFEAFPDFQYKGRSITSHSWLQPSF
ncbi:F-box protein At3g56470-like [Rosa rugosa]|uniref:F-box protein At3g56470-like n=1 Tax=Rosa rugosa TaxID=74645 RepID=UPI002B414962|nr:F-box protein At3g56470-like [Rosa rugosa]